MDGAVTFSAADEAMFYAIVATADRRGSSRRKLGTAATVSQLVGGEEVNRMEVRITDLSGHGIGIRSPVPLARGDIYRMRMGPEDGTCIRIVHSRRRYDGTYDVGARRI